MIDFRGLGSELVKALEKLNLDVHTRAKGNKFKGAVEPFMYEKMSPKTKFR